MLENGSQEYVHVKRQAGAVVVSQAHSRDKSCMWRSQLTECQCQVRSISVSNHMSVCVELNPTAYTSPLDSCLLDTKFCAIRVS